MRSMNYPHSYRTVYVRVPRPRTREEIKAHDDTIDELYEAALAKMTPEMRAKAIAYNMRKYGK